MPTKTELIAIFRNSYPACSDADASRHFDEAYQKFLVDVSLRQSSVAITLVAGTWEYDLDENLKNVYQVRYVTSAETDGRLLGSTLVATSPQIIIAQNLEYAINQGAGQPNRYALLSAVNGSASKSQIIVDPVPSISSAGSPLYPRLQVDGTYVTALSGSDSVGDDIPDPYVIVSRMKARYSREFVPQDQQMNSEEYSVLLNEAKNFIYERQRIDPPSLQPQFFQRQRRAV